MKNNSTALHVRIDSHLKKEAEKIINALGLDTSSAIRLFLQQVVNHQTIPFDLIPTENLDTDNCPTPEKNPIKIRHLRNSLKTESD